MRSSEPRARFRNFDEERLQPQARGCQEEQEIGRGRRNAVPATDCGLAPRQNRLRCLSRDRAARGHRLVRLERRREIHRKCKLAFAAVGRVCAGNLPLRSGHRGRRPYSMVFCTGNCSLHPRHEEQEEEQQRTHQRHADEAMPERQRRFDQDQSPPTWRARCGSRYRRHPGSPLGTSPCRRSSPCRAWPDPSPGTPWSSPACRGSESARA